MAELDEDFLETLKGLRGEFENTRGGRIGNRVLAHIFSTLFPIFFLLYLILWTDMQWPLQSEQWLILSFAVATLVMGFFIHRSINSRFVFDDEGIKEYRQNGGLKGAIRWTELVRVEFRESRGIKSFLFKTKDSILQLEFYKSISDAMASAEADR